MRTRGYGRASITRGNPAPRLATEGAAGRAEARAAWSNQLLAYLADPSLAVTGLVPEHSLAFSLTFPAGAVLVDDLLRYTLDPAAMVRWLPPMPPVAAVVPWRDRLGVPVDGGVLRCLAAVTWHERLRGWNAAHGLPRQDEWVIVQGAVYAYLFEGDDPARQLFQTRLDRLERHGSVCAAMKGSAT